MNNSIYVEQKNFNIESLPQTQIDSRIPKIKKRLPPSSQSFKPLSVNLKKFRKPKPSESAKQVLAKIVNGKFNGEARITNENGSILEGTFKNGRLKGYGKIIHDNGDMIFEGEFSKGMLNGLGKQTNTVTKEIREGEFSRDELNGHGKITFLDDGEVWEGEFLDGNLNGDATKFFPNGNILQAEFKDDKLHGHATLFYPNRDILIGDFKNDLLKDQVIVIRKDGTIGYRTFEKCKVIFSNSLYAK
jgi:hypothetical protein